MRVSTREHIQTHIKDVGVFTGTCLFVVVVTVKSKRPFLSLSFYSRNKQGGLDIAYVEVNL